jgi:hypothetical protein
MYIPHASITSIKLNPVAIAHIGKGKNGIV